MSRGFTLVEALVAFTLLAIVLGAVATATSTGLAGLSRSEEAANRLHLGRSILAATGVETPLAPGETSGVLPSGDRWRLFISRVDAAEAAPPGLYRAELTLFDDDRPALTLSVLKAGG